MSVNEESVEGYLSREYERRAARIVRALHDLADEVERAAEPWTQTSVDGTPRHVSAAGQVVHIINSGMMNIKVDMLVSAAAQVDLAEALREAKAAGEGA